jgi:hypothetical protein
MNEYILKLKKLFPKELLARPYWVGWKDLNESKVPINLKNGQMGRSNDSSTWVPFQMASLTFAKYGCSGLGFVLQPPFIGIDLDDCTDQQGVLTPFASSIINKTSSYAEFSPNHGLHIFCKGTIPNAVKKDEIEIYQTGRFFTVTGRHIEGTPPTVRTLTNELDEYFTKEQTKNPPGWVSEALLDMKIGNIDTTLFRILSKLRNDGFSEQDAHTLLSPYADRAGATPGHLDDKINHVWKTYNPKNVSVIETSLGDQLLKEAQSQSVSQDQTYSIENFLAIEDKVTWIVPGLIADKTLGFIAGLPETGKTWICMDLAIECARGGGYWLGKFATKDCKVLYIDQERWKGETKRRLSAIIGAKAIAKESIHDNLFIKSGTTIRLDLQHSFDAFYREIDKLRPSLIIVDSFATFHTKEENNRKDIQEVLERVKQIRNDFGCAFLFVDHEGKSVFSDEDKTPSMGKMVGSIGKPAAAEYVLTVRKEGESSMVYHTKSTLGPTIEPFLVTVTDMCEDKSKISVKGY